MLGEGTGLEDHGDKHGGDGECAHAAVALGSRQNLGDGAGGRECRAREEEDHGPDQGPRCEGDDGGGGYGAARLAFVPCCEGARSADGGGDGEEGETEGDEVKYDEVGAQRREIEGGRAASDAHLRVWGAGS